MKNKTISPEDRLKNVAEIGLKYSVPTRKHNGKGKASTYSTDPDTMAETLAHLSELVLAYLKGEVKPIENGDCPF